MFNTKLPTSAELPSSQQLLRSTTMALIAAVVLLVTVVMPSEYAIDPTGVGRVLGLTQMGEIKLQLSEEASADAAATDTVAASESLPLPAANVADNVRPAPAPAEAAAQPVPSTGLKHEMSISLDPGQGAEIKLEMLKGAKVKFSWTANGAQVNYDTHGDPYDAPRGFYHGYGKGRATPEAQGTLEAAFDGKHGWYWRNRSGQPVTVTLRTEGDYISIKRVI